MNSKTPLVSIAVLSYNHEKFIEQAIASFLMQNTTFDFEIVIGDDASKDRTPQLLGSYQERHPDIFKIRYHDSNIGMIRNFIETLNNCRGKYIAFCEGDDYWIDPNKLQTQVDYLERHTAVGICFHDAKIFDENSQTHIPDAITNTTKTTFDLSDLVKGNFMHTPTVMLRNNFELPAWFNAMPIGDWPLYLFQIKDQKIHKLSGAMAAYRVHSASAWSSKTEIYKLSRTIKVMELILKHIPLSEAQKKIISGQMQRHKTDKKHLEGSWFKKLKTYLRAKH